MTGNSGKHEQSELEQLKRQLQQYEDIVRCLPVGLIFIDDEDNVAMVNPLGQEIRCVGERVGRPVSDCHPPGTHEMLAKVMRRFRDAPLDEQHPIVLERLHRYEVTYSRVSKTDGEFSGVLWMAHDISRRKQLERELLHAERLAGLGRMAAKVAHDIKNPLNAIQGAAHYLQNGTTVQEGDDLTGLIKEQVARIADLIDRLTALTRPLQPKMESADLGEILQSQMRACRMSHPEAHCSLTVDEDLEIVLCDVKLIERLVSNAVENAFAAMLGKGELSVHVHCRAEEDGTWATISFQDSGPGFSQEVLDHVGEPFVTTRPDGTGLGLTIMREICLLHGGDLSVGNTEQGALVTAVLSVR